MIFLRLIRQSLTPSAALRPAVFFAILLWTLLANALDVGNLQAAELPIRLGIIAIAQVIHWCSILVVVGLFQLAGYRIRGVPFLWVLIFAAGVRGVLVQEAFDAFAVNPTASTWVRFTFSVLYVGLGMVVVAIWLQQVGQHNRLMADLNAEQERLRLVRTEAEQKILEANQVLIAKIRKDLLERVRRLSGNKPLESLAELQAAIDQVVRPMSEQLAYQNTAWEPDKVLPKRLKVSWRRVITESFYIDNIHPIAITVLTTILIAPNTIHVLSFNNAWLALILAPLSLGGFLWIYRLQMRKCLHASSMRVQRIATLIGFFGGAITSNIVARLLISPMIPNLLIPSQSVVYAVLISVIVALVTQTLRAMRSVERDLEKMTGEASWEITRIRQIHRELEQELANKLHGKIQATLAASYLKLARSITEGRTDEGSLDEFKTVLVRSINDLGVEGSRPSRFDEVLRETKETWADVCQISVEIEPEVKDVIVQDGLLSHALEDLVPELTFNSIKHGKATSLQFSIRMETSRTLLLSASDNGQQAIQSGRVGLGSKLLDECCISWTRETADVGTVTTCLLPLKFSPPLS